jgi:hypothetical protein
MGKGNICGMTSVVTAQPPLLISILLTRRDGYEMGVSAHAIEGPASALSDKITERVPAPIFAT